ncbi:MAG: hypothetical protein ACRCUT_12075 [Spirochaetota bacterium]
MSLSAEELNALCEKLRNRYDEYAKKYSPVWFNRQEFESRFTSAKRNRMDIEGFILAEISNFEKVRERYESKRKQKESFTKKVDAIIEENLSRIKKYPSMEFHPRAGIEIRYLYGALAELSQGYMPVLWLICTDYHKKNLITGMEHSLQQFALPRGSKPPAAIEDHILLLNRATVTELEIEKGRSTYMKESAFMLYDIITFCDSILSGRSTTELENPVRFDKAFFSPDVKKRVIDLFSDSTGYGAIVKIKDRCGEILSDFRLTAFRPSGK